MAHLHSVYDTDPHFMIDPITRAIKNVSSKKTKIMQHDHNSERFTFEIPRTVEAHDMSECTKIEVHYINIDSKTEAFVKDIYLVDDMQISPNAENEDVVIFSWLVSENATNYAGSLNFLIRFSCVAKDGTIEYAWNTDIFTSMSVSSGMYHSEAVVDKHSDVLEKWKQDLIESGGVTDERIAEAVSNYLGENGMQHGSSARIGEVVLLAENWEGEGNLFSQIVAIDGVTENTQVDLTPSVEQLAIFYEKDLAFVTENEDGVVTVFAIGQKPQNDYTIQVTMTEVNYE